MPIVDIKGIGQAKFPDGMDTSQIRDFLRQKYSQRAINGQSDALSPQPNTVAAYNPSLVDKIGSGIASGLTSTGLISDNYRAQQIGKNISSIGEFLPGVGDATAGDEFGRAVAKGDKTGIALSALGVIPVVGDTLKKAVNVAKKNYDIAFKPLQAEYKLASAARKSEILQEARVLRQPLDFAQSELTRSGLNNTPTKAAEKITKEPNKTFKGKVFHQTSEDFEDFDLSKGADGTAWFTGDKKNFTNPESSASAASGKGRILEREVELKKVAGFKELDQFSVDELRQQGYDGAMLDGDIQVFDQKAIKQSLPMGEVKQVTSYNDMFDFTPEQMAQQLRSSKPDNVINGVYIEQTKFGEKRFNPDGSVEIVKGGEVLRRIEPQDADMAYKNKIMKNEGEKPEVKAAQEKRKAEFDAERIKQQAQEAESYKMQHTAPTREDNPSGDDLTDTFGSDIYTGNALQYFGTGSSYDNKAIKVIQGMKGKPEKAVTIYRAVPSNVKSINSSDWVTTTKEYAQDHMEGEEGWHILSKKVKAKDIATDGNSIHEFGYDPAN